ncbi:MAG: F0F1 ATP synthase subunit A [Patescibacteria group bacterium]
MDIPPIAAETIFHIGSFGVTNTYVNSTIVTLLFVCFAFFLRNRISKIPGKLQNAFETLVEFLLGYFDQVTHDREKSKRFLPLVGTLFMFILVSNWFGLLPGSGSVGVWQMVAGHLQLVPIMRSANSDLNLTLAMAILSVLATHVFGIITLGFFVHANKYIQLGTIWKAVKSLNPVKMLTAIVEFMVGLIEIFSEIAKVVSLSLRLFGNVFAGEVLLTVITGLVAYFIPLPFMAMELLVGVVQASVFALLVLVYLTVATDSPHGDEEHDDVHDPAHMTEAVGLETH